MASQFDKWLYVLKNLSEFQDNPNKLQEKIFEKLFEEAEIAKLKPEDMRKYEESLKTFRDNENTLEYAKKLAAEEALERGLEGGLEKGLEKGLKRGREEGLEAGRIEIARMLKINGVSIELIAKSTGLTTEQIENLL